LKKSPKELAAFEPSTLQATNKKSIKVKNRFFIKAEIDESMR
jgi:hypothetical protein